MAIAHYVAPVSPDDPVLDLLRQAPSGDDDDKPHDDPVHVAIDAAIVGHPDAIDLWRMAQEVDQAFGSPFGPQEYAWTPGAEDLPVETIRYVRPEQVRRAHDAIGDLAAQALMANLVRAHEELAVNMEALIAKGAQPRSLRARSLPPEDVVAQIRQRATREGHEVVERAVALQSLVRSAAERGMGLLDYFSP